MQQREKNLLIGLVAAVLLWQGGIPEAHHRIADVLVERAIMPDRKSTRLNSSHIPLSRMPSSA